MRSTLPSRSPTTSRAARRRDGAGAPSVRIRDTAMRCRRVDVASTSAGLVAAIERSAEPISGAMLWHGRSTPARSSPTELATDRSARRAGSRRVRLPFAVVGGRRRRRRCSTRCVIPTSFAREQTVEAYRALVADGRPERCRRCAAGSGASCCASRLRDLLGAADLPAVGRELAALAAGRVSRPRSSSSTRSDPVRGDRDGQARRA